MHSLPKSLKPADCLYGTVNFLRILLTQYQHYIIMKTIVFHFLKYTERINGL